MTTNLEQGQVKFFLNDPRKRFGFIFRMNGEELFFRESSYRLLFADDGQKFNFYGSENDRAPRVARPGNVVFFEVGEDSRGRSRAEFWCFYEDQVRALRDLAERPVYRVRIQVAVPDDPRVAPEILWEGTNLDALNLRFPRYADRQFDELQSEFQKKMVCFERRTTEGWKTVDDPRRLAMRRPYKAFR